ncbi:hypothetical protein Q1695_006808 [Nippostrongylus brasiliensis]|nr:hypothetical protein Q1695_006808 [Nippostrongylus brasiliensis]
MVARQQQVSASAQLVKKGGMEYEVKLLASIRLTRSKVHLLHYCQRRTVLPELRQMFTLLVILSVVTLASFDQVDNTVDKLPLFMRTESVRHVVELFYSMPSSERKVISTAADRFARDHHKPTFYAQLMDTNLKLFEAMDVAVTRFTDRIAYIKESISNQFAMEMTVVMECAFHEVFRKSNMKPIDSLMLQWAKQFLKLPVDAQKGFEGEFPCLANELRDLGGGVYNISFSRPGLEIVGIFEI